MAKITARALADSAANELNFPSANDLVTALNNGVKNGNQADIATLTSFTANLTQKVLQQEIISNRFKADKNISFIQKFLDSDFVGNAIERMVILATGDDAYDPNQFVPTSPTIPVIEASTQQYYVMDETIPNKANLASGSFSRKKNLTWQKQTWSTYFLQGKYDEFVAQVMDNLKKPIFLRLYNWLVYGLVNLTPQKVVTLTGTDAFTSWIEVFENINYFVQETAEYNYNANSKFIAGTPKENLSMIMSIKTYNTLKTGIQSQLFNSARLDLSNLINDENIHLPYKGYNIPSSSEVITLLPDNLIPDNKIIVYDNRGINVKMKFDVEEGQLFAQNVAMQHTLISQGNFSLQPWLKVMVINAPNINVQPSTVAV